MFLIACEIDDARIIRNKPSFFDNERWITLCKVGLITNKVRLVHSGMMHYQNYQSLPTQKEKINRVITVLRSCYENGRSLKFRRLTDSDEKKEVGEIIGTSVGLEAIHSSSDLITAANFNKLPRPARGQTAPDYELCVIGQPIIKLEVKGRQSASIGKAQEACTRQLGQFNPPKYALITKTIYNERSSCKLFLSDPEIPLEICSRKKALITVLKHYCKCMFWAGFYQFAQVLIERLAAIERQEDYKIYDGMHLEDMLVRKVGKVYEGNINHRIDEKSKLITHIPAELFNKTHEDVFIKTDGYELGFFVDQQLYQVLNEQDFDKILNYKTQSDTVILSDGTYIDHLDDGTVLYVKHDD